MDGGGGLCLVLGLYYLIIMNDLWRFTERLVMMSREEAL